MSASSSCAGQLLEAHRAAAEALGEPDRAVVVAVGDEDGLDPARGQRPRGQLGRLAGADQQHARGRRGRRACAGASSTATEGIETPALADPGLGAGPLAGRERAAEEAVEDRPGRALDERQLVGALDLALDLGLAEDHRVEPGGDPEEVARGLDAAAASRGCPTSSVGRIPACAGEHAEREALGLDRVGDDEVELGAVAGRDRRRLVDLLGVRSARRARRRRGPRSARAARAARAARSCARRRARAARSWRTSSALARSASPLPSRSRSASSASSAARARSAAASRP